MFKKLLIILSLAPSIAMVGMDDNPVAPQPDNDALVAPDSPGTFGTGTVPAQAPGAPARITTLRRRPASPHHLPQGAVAQMNNNRNARIMNLMQRMNYPNVEGVILPGMRATGPRNRRQPTGIQPALIGRNLFDNGDNDNDAANDADHINSDNGSESD